MWLDSYCKECRASKNKENYTNRKTVAAENRGQLIAKQCNKCRLLKDASQFYPWPSSDGFTGSCKNCSEYRTSDRKHYLKKKYNITPKEYETLYTKQKSQCALCERKFQRLAIDHDHQTGKIRGLLCIACNTGIGKLGDTIPALEKAIKYLLNQEVTSV